eukprot:scaffold145914_cov22-Tisochrysis_lutea.AAC.1
MHILHNVVRPACFVWQDEACMFRCCCLGPGYSLASGVYDLNDEGFASAKRDVFGRELQEFERAVTFERHHHWQEARSGRKTNEPTLSVCWRTAQACMPELF